ncbi:MAG TPA: hypothetical protein PK639_01510 [Candidatus Woesebacteria bacterium]|nr:hypothetical protein [Candidatus Woesebacteria bacterium]
MAEIIFPSIPHFPGEDKEKQYHGAPKNLFDSVLLMGNYDPKYLGKDPKQIGSLLSTLTLIDLTDKENRDRAVSIRKELKRDLFNIGFKSEYDLQPDSCLFFIETAAENPEIAGDVENLLAGLLSREKDPTKLIDTLYQATSLGLDKDNDNLTRYLLRVFCFDTNILREDSKLSRLYLSNIFSERDTALQQFMELDAFGEMLANYYDPDLIKNKIAKTEKAIQKIVEGIDKPDKRVRSILQFYEDNQTGLTEIIADKKDEFPYNLVVNGGIVRNKTYQIYCEISGNETIQPINIPDGPRLLARKGESEENIDNYQGIVREYLEKFGDKEHRLNDSETRTVLNILRPKIDFLKNIGQLNQLIAEYRQLINLDPKRSIGVNGTEIMINDPQLLNLGYRSIVFNYGDRVPEMKVNICLGNGNLLLPLRLDSKKQLVGENGQPLKDIDVDYLSAKWIEAVILSHLFEYTCSENDEGFVVNERTDNDRQTILKRVGHLRRLRENEEFSENQVVLAREEQGWDLTAINQYRFNHGLSKVTYVRIVDKQSKTENKKPDKFKAKTAMGLLNGKISNANN